MSNEKSLTKVRNNRIGIRRAINNVIELLKSKVNKDYTLSEDSPEFLRRNKDLILKTIKKDCNYLNQVPDDILLEELRQQTLPTDGIIYTAFEKGYSLNGTYHGTPSSKILLGEEAKTAILQYIEMQKKGVLLQGRLEDVLDHLDESLLSDTEFREELVTLAIKKGYEITYHSQMYLKQNATLAENYYRNLLEKKDVSELSSRYTNVLNPELIKNKEFLQKYINMLSQKGIADKTIISTLIYKPECIEALKSDIGLFQVVFEQTTQENLDEFFHKFFSDEEIKSLFAQQDKLNGKLLRLSQLYAKDPNVLKSLNSKLLGEKYQNIPLYKMQLFARMPEFQEKILGLDDYRYSLYTRMTQLVAQETNRWNRFDQNIIRNLPNGDYETLLTDLYQQAKQGNKITAKDIETLIFLISHAEDNELERGAHNVFNITNKNELEHYEEIRELVCDAVLTNPSLDNEQVVTPLSKYLGKFRQISEIDRMKLALLEKYYNMDLKEAENIIHMFAMDIDNVSANDDQPASIIEQIKAIKNIFECADINVLSQVSELDVLVQTDLSTSTYLIEQSKEMFEQKYQENLYMPKGTEKIGNVTCGEKNVEVFDAGTDFSMIVKRVGYKNNNSKEIWNSMSDYSGDLRFYTCTSYMTDENILSELSPECVILGFAQGVNAYSFDLINRSDAGTTYYNGDRELNYFDGVRNEYMMPDTLEMNTSNGYNEVLINTLKTDEYGNMHKLQPDYVVYIKEKSDVDLEDLEDDVKWRNTKKVASDFGIPIVVIDREKIRESERTKIESMSKDLTDGTSCREEQRFVKKIEHYERRYGDEDTEQYKGQVKKLKEDIEQKQLEEKAKKSVPNLATFGIEEQTTSEKTDEEDMIYKPQLSEDTQPTLPDNMPPYPPPPYLPTSPINYQSIPQDNVPPPPPYPPTDWNEKSQKNQDKNEDNERDER